MNQTPPTADTVRLAELITRKRKILEQVNVLTQMQPETIEKGDTGRLLHVLAAKDRLLNDLQSVERELAPFRDQEPEDRVWRSVDDRMRCRAEAEQCEAILKEVMVTEQACERKLVDRRDRTATQLHAANDASRARTAYASDAGVRRSLDISSE